MPTVTYKKQPAIHKTGGHVYSGNKLPYTVTKVLWPEEVELYIKDRLIGTSLHVCCGKSQIGDVRLDLYESDVNIKADAAALPFSAHSFDTVFADPPYNGVFSWQHKQIEEMGRVARKRIIFQHWFMPIDNKGAFKKNHSFMLSEVALWQPRTYFGRAQVITIMDFIVRCDACTGHGGKSLMPNGEWVPDECPVCGSKPDDTMKVTTSDAE